MYPHPYSPPTVAVIGSLADLTQGNAPAIGVDAFACVGNVVVANVSLSTGTAVNLQLGGPCSF